MFHYTNTNLRMCTTSWQAAIIAKTLRETAFGASVVNYKLLILLSQLPKQQLGTFLHTYTMKIWINSFCQRLYSRGSEKDSLSVIPHYNLSLANFTRIRPVMFR